MFEFPHVKYTSLGWVNEMIYTTKVVINFIIKKFKCHVQKPWRSKNVKFVNARCAYILNRFRLMWNCIGLCGIMVVFEDWVLMDMFLHFGSTKVQKLCFLMDFGKMFIIFKWIFNLFTQWYISLIEKDVVGIQVYVAIGECFPM